MLRCNVLGHRYRFRTEGSTMIWDCERCHARGGSKAYASASEAKRHARVFDREDRTDLGARAPLVGLFPLRLWHLWRRWTRSSGR
jgi:hypothetical protein